MTKYDVRLVELTPKMARSKDYTFKADPKLRNVFILQFEQYRTIRITIKPKRWWQR